MNVTVNGEVCDLAPTASVAELLPADSRGLAVAVNGVVVPRARHAATTLSEGDVVEIVTAVQGG
jgi:sulfur carrier protein